LALSRSTRRRVMTFDRCVLDILLPADLSPVLGSFDILAP
jgi:hypothetical protein